jgi:hypothetical protein
MDFGDLSDNPFALELSKPKHSRRKSVVSALKFLLLVAGCLAVTLLISSQSRRWLVHRLTHDFDSLSGQAKQARLIQIADLDALAIEPLVKALADDDMNVARTAYELLRQSQTSWTVLEHGEQQRRHASMVEALASIAIHMPDDRTGWGTSLLQQTILATVERQDDQSTDLYRDATHAIELLSLSDRSGPSILSAQPLDPLTPKRLTIRSEPLPLSFSGLESDSQVTETPQPASTSTIVSRSSSTDSSQPPQSTDPSVYRSSTVRLQPIDPDEPVILRDLEQPRETSYQTGDHQQADEIQSVAHLVDSPMETFDNKSVMHWLGSPQQVLRDKARLELISRGFDDTQLHIATQIASGDVQSRIALIDSIARSDSIDPRPWLLMMLSDKSRDVKLRVISVLATMKDPDVSSQLRMHLVDERDPTVAFRIRRVLDLR